MGEPSSEGEVKTTPKERLTAASTQVYTAAQSPTALRCGDLVDVEWEGSWFPGMVTDIPGAETLAVAYTNGDFEDSVPLAAARLRSIPPKRRERPKGGKREKLSLKLSEAANAGDIGLVLQALREGSDPKMIDDLGYTPLHWAAAPDDGMPGDTISRRACIAILARLGDVDASDGTHLQLRGVQHSVSGAQLSNPRRPFNPLSRAHFFLSLSRVCVWLASLGDSQLCWMRQDIRTRRRRHAGHGALGAALQGARVAA